MTRMSKQGERRSVSPRRRRVPGPKTGPKRDNLPRGFREHQNAVAGTAAQQLFIPKVN